MKRLAIFAAVLVGIVVVGAAWVVHALRSTTTTSTFAAVLPHDELPRAPDGVRIRVQVLNTTGTQGLARRATRLLRDQGFDVVDMGNGSPALDTTVVVDRSGHPEWAATVAKVLKPAASRTERDSSRYLDVTVLLGRSWRPPPQPFNP
ncbi:MAG TPA: LytR C-terminal domain-containing protein [Gemmatimonadaceae bacterium]|nr:LytR C-terminal domain-containing protein [Gemmatimonadaceae bacterium]